MVMHLRKTLEIAPQPRSLPGIAVRNFLGLADVPLWLHVRHRAFAHESLGVREWNEADFAAEFLNKPWWSPDRMWFAIPAPPHDDLSSNAQLSLLPDVASHASLPLGTVTLSQRAAGAAGPAVVHWLAVLPGWRRRGVGRLLLATLEARAWELGHREVVIETHSAWKRAWRFYESLGYRQTDPMNLPTP